MHFPKFPVGDEMTCPYKNCKNNNWHHHDLIYDQLIYNGPCTWYVNWICEVISDNHRINHGRAEYMEFEGTSDFGDNSEDMFQCTNGTNGPNDNAKKKFGHLEEGKQP